jgi:hypothetical protein
MISFKTFTVALALSVAGATSAFAQLSEPAAFAAMHPDRDVLNGGILTPEARMRARGLVDAAPAYPDAYAGSMAAVPHRRHHRHPR